MASPPYFNVRDIDAYKKRASEMLPKYEKWEEILREAAKEAHERETDWIPEKPNNL